MRYGITSSWVDFQGNPIHKVVQLGRTSGYSQEQEETIKTQIAVMDSFCESHGWQINDRYLDEDCSNETSLKDRKDGSRLWRLLQSPNPLPFQAIITYSVDRWSRHPPVFWPEYWHARQRGVRLISATQALDDSTDEGVHLVLPVLLAVGSYDKTQINRKLHNGRKRLLDERYVEGESEYGYWSGGLVPYGYRQIEHRRRWILTLDEEALPDRDFSGADVIRWIFLWVVEEQLTARAIADRLNTRNVPTYAQLPPGRGRYDPKKMRTSGHWQPAQITNILHDTLYAGVHFYGKRPGSQRHSIRDLTSRELPSRPMPAIVSTRAWYGAQTTLDQNRTWSPRNTHRFYLLRGLIRCTCPYTFYGHAAWSQGRPVDGLWYYTCRGASLKKRDCLAIHGLRCLAHSLRGPDIEQDVLARIQSFIDQPSRALEQLRHEITTGESDTERLVADVDQLQAQLAGLEDERVRANRLFLQRRGQMTERQLDRLLAEIDTEEEGLRLQIAERQALLDQARDIEQHLEGARTSLESLGREIGPIVSWPIERQRRVVERCVREIVVTPGQGEESQTVKVKFWFRTPEAIATNTSHSVFRNYITETLHLVSSCRRAS